MFLEPMPFSIVVTTVIVVLLLSALAIFFIKLTKDKK
nr:hypothetical protein [Campylobacter novaezeelandiae]